MQTAVRKWQHHPMGLWHTVGQPRWRSGRRVATVTAMVALLAAALVGGGLRGGSRLAAAYAQGSPSTAVWTWGESSYPPLQVAGLTGVVQVGIPQVGTYLGLKDDGTVWAWGGDDSGDLGQGAVGSTYSTPVQVPGLPPVRKLATGWGSRIVLALGDGGQVWAWGDDSSGGLGDGTRGDPSCGCRSAPLQVLGPGGAGHLDGATAIATSASNSYAVSNGKVYAWGSNIDGMLGDGAYGISQAQNGGRLLPAPVSALDGQHVVALASGVQTLALTGQGHVWSWGGDPTDWFGPSQIHCEGNVPAHFCDPNPTQVSGLSGVTTVASGSDHNLALTSAGSVWAWGYDYLGQDGDGTLGASSCVCRALPVRVSGLSRVTTIAAGYSDSFAIQGGKVYGWGDDGAGQIDGTTGDRGQAPDCSSCRLSPIQVASLTGATFVSTAGRGSAAIAAPGPGTLTPPPAVTTPSTIPPPTTPPTVPPAPVGGPAHAPAPAPAHAPAAAPTPAHAPAAAPGAAPAPAPGVAHAPVAAPGVAPGHPAAAAAAPLANEEPGAGTQYAMVADRGNAGLGNFGVGLGLGSAGIAILTMVAALAWRRPGGADPCAGPALAWACAGKASEGRPRPVEAPCEAGGRAMADLDV
ncbi:MAG: hypothetical protein DLM54_07150 [Acidimicrobiales bacterium]|nr:MAG: hypothetical protein DLM54_07150 [Acidimicrobiales bacterium]